MMFEKAIEILSILNNNGYEAYIVGGYVRDKILNLENKDIDIITSATPKVVCNIFNVDINDNFGSLKLKYNDYEFDITTFRKEFDYHNNRWPDKIEYVLSLKEDLKRRDFTFNSICIDKEGNYIDLYNGIDDLKNRVIRTIGNSDNKIKEDSLRILRAIRFSAVYNLKIDKELSNSIIKYGYLINNLSFDRIKNELDIVFSTNNVANFFKLIDYFDLYKNLEISLKNDVISTNNYLSIWAQINYSSKYNFSNFEKKYINELRNILKEGINNYTVYKYNFAVLNEANKILLNNVDIEKIYNNLIIKSRKDIDITYEEMINITKDKSKINSIYVDLEKQILYNKLKNEKKYIISYLKGDNNE